MKLIQKLPKTVCSRFTNSFATLNPYFAYPQNVVNKIVIHRGPEETTIQQLHQHLKSLFPEFTIQFDMSAPALGSKITPKVQKQNVADEQNIKKYAFIDGLLNNTVHFYEVSNDGVVEQIYGIQIAEYNQTNRINLPEFIEDTITEINSQWSSQMTIAKALSFDNIPQYGREVRETRIQQKEFQKQRRPESLQSSKQDQQQIESLSLTRSEERTLQQSINTIIRISQFKRQVNYTYGPASFLMTKILALMSTNWLFLFAITYGKYGWDVGEPVSYLTSLGVDLMAMIGYFEAERALQLQMIRDKQVIINKCNMESQLRMAQWRMAYLSRKSNI